MGEWGFCGLLSTGGGKRVSDGIYVYAVQDFSSALRVQEARPGLA